ncbi:DNA polymerase III subunit epsilon [Niveispirillum sp.]|uniref:DNA polymerase III subunit epsilon n=1 Tax=Niveispirillum sp. TaxID=1917217 RepID=UPI001B56F8AF|nr:DNA polymerase III subunit epsilon [Niveispirillum sp.]MBP7334622.1 DNA polymerase III subunit epsilon [Niveispirillum sp.]
MREIVLDTETTGIDPLNGDRIVEIGCVELFNHVSTGKHYHTYLNPERDMPAEAEAVHGLSAAFLSDKPLFPAIVGDFLEFIGDAQLVIHNASFDIGFLNMELVRIGMGKLSNPVVDTVKIARKRFPGAPASLDALCRRFEIDNSNRTLHGALLDSQLLAEVYLELMGGRQPDLVLAGGPSQNRSATDGGPTRAERTFRPARPHAPPPDELAAHEAFVKGLKNAAWLAS